MRHIVKHWNLQRYAAVVSVLLVAVFYTNLDLYSYATGLLPYSVAPKYVMLVLGALSLPIIWQRVRQGRVSLDDKLLVFVVVVGCISLASLAAHFDSANLELFEVQASALLLLLVGYLVFRDGDALLAARWAVLVCLTFAILVSLIEIVFPEVSSFPGRSTSLYLNPNINAFALNIGLVLTIGLLPPRMRLTFLIAVAAAVFGTLSKAGMVILAMIVIILWLQGTLRVSWRRSDILVTAFAALSFVLLFAYAYTNVPQYFYFVCAQSGSVTKLAETVGVGSIEVGGSGEECRRAANGEASLSEQRAEQAAAEQVAAEQPAAEQAAAEQAAAKEPAIGQETEGAAVEEAPVEEDAGAAVALGKYSEEVSNMVPSDVASDGVSESEVAEVAEVLGASDSTASRAWLLQYGISTSLQNPIWGISMARAWDLVTHNSYVLYALAYGLIGWLIIPALALVILTSGDIRVTLPMALVLLLASVFSHNMLTDRAVLIPFALAAATNPEAASHNLRHARDRLGAISYLRKKKA